MPSYDAILVPGGGVREGGLLPSWVRRRLDLAVQVREGSYIVTLSAGTTHRPPPLSAGGYPIFESIAAARYLIAAGVPPHRVLAETHSYDTIGNAFFSRVVHVDPLGMRSLLVITSDFHLPRTQFVFNWIYGLKPEELPYEIDFRGVADPEMDPSVLRERVEKERKSLQVLAPFTQRLTTMKDFHRWLFAEHDAYNATRKGFGDRKDLGEALESY
jgi:uncharacterized SAM-binding protein YcdF (DUF218 family)